MKFKAFMNGEITLKKKVFVLILFVVAVFLGLMITFAGISGQRLRQFQDAQNGYNLLAQQIQANDATIQDLNKKITDMEFEARVQEVYIEVANKETEEQKAYVKEYQDYLNDLKVQLALRGIETGDFSALDAIGEDFAKQYEDLKAKEAEIEAEQLAAQEALANSQVEQPQEETGEEGNPWVDMYNGIKENEGE